MKRLHLIILSALLSFTAAAQTIGDAFYIYRSDGQVNGFLRDDVWHMSYSCLDLDNIEHEDYVTQEIYPPDSTYRIPLAIIDSISFVTPKTLYADDVQELSGDLFSYLTSVDGMCLTFSPSTPSRLLPKVGEKLATVEMTELLPCGFLGQVSSISTDEAGTTLCCDSIPLTDAVKRFYAVIEVTSSDYSKANQRRAPYQYDSRSFVNLPALKGDFDLSAIITQRNVYDYSGIARAEFDLRPRLDARLTITIDEDRLLQHAQARITTTMNGKMKLELAGEAKKNVMRDVLRNLTFSGDYPLPFGFSLYGEIGPRLEMNGEFAVGVTLYPWYSHTIEINSTLLPVGDAYVPISNTVEQNMDQGVSMNWDHVAGRFSGKACVYGRMGLAWGTHRTAWVGGEAEAGFKGEAEVYLDMAALQTADRSTVLYETINPLWKADIKRYYGLYFIASAANDRFQFKHGGDRNWGDPYFQGRLLPQFSDLDAGQINPDSINATTHITNDCFIPFTVGFTALNESGQMVGEPFYCKDKYWTRYMADRSFRAGQSDIKGSAVHKVYPTIKVFGHDMLATPYTDKLKRVITKEPTFVGAVGATLCAEVENFERDERDTLSYIGFRYLSEDELKEKAKDGEEPWETLARCGHYERDECKWSEVDDGTFKYNTFSPNYYNNLELGKTYYYIPYFSYRTPVLSYDGSIRYWSSDCHYGNEVTSFTTRLCPDENHPHMIDLGLPSGNKWACCNVGASKPEEYGGYYAWGETEEKNDYRPGTYKFSRLVKEATVQLHPDCNRGYWGNTNHTIWIAEGCYFETFGNNIDFNNKYINSLAVECLFEREEYEELEEAWGEFLICNYYHDSKTNQYYYCTGLNINDSIMYDDGTFGYGINISGTEHDVAHVKWGEGWHIPLGNEQGELRDYSTTQRNFRLNGVVGSFVIGNNGNGIFIPYSGYYNYTSCWHLNESSGWWDPLQGYYNPPPKLFWTIDYNPWPSLYAFEYYMGVTVRPVSK